ncbi:MAG: hypothetical protein JO353_12970, partial [Phycisphaerae bacterium]|nr:hypothetical protein [Phycisphaerae bacterium]
TSTERSKTTYLNAIGSMTETRSAPAGQPTVTAASVNLPRSDFLKRFKDENPGSKDPDEQTLEKWANYELENVRKRVASACGMKSSDERVVVGIYLDSAADVAVAGVAPAVSSSIGTSLVSHAKEIAIGVLALVSLFMVSTMVRKSGPAGSPSFAGAGGLTGAFGGLLDARSVASFSGDDDVAAVVGGGHAAMEGIELDDDSFKAQQMVEQVTSMVQENPDAAASLIKRWLNK